MENKHIKRNENNDSKYFNYLNKKSDQEDEKEKLPIPEEEEEMQYFTE